MIYHIVVGDATAVPLQEAVASSAEMSGEVIALKDLLHLGPLQKSEGQSFAEMRSAFWNEVIADEKAPVQVPDMERILELSKQMFEDESIKVWIWMAPWPADVAAYYWLLKYMSKHPGRFFVVNIAGLPFLNELGKVYFPKSITEILPRELVKARRLARAVTASEYEVDGDEWHKLQDANAGIRTLEGTKRLVSQPISYYDGLLLGYCTRQFQKASKVMNAIFSKNTVTTGDLFMTWRLRELVREGAILLQGKPDRTLKDFEIRLPGEMETVTESLPEAQ